jgi:hypothetical protein
LLLRHRAFLDDQQGWGWDSQDLGYTLFEISVHNISIPPEFQSASIKDGILTMTLAIEAGQSLQVQYKSDLTQAIWTNLGSPIAATNSSLTISDSTRADSKRFYRVNFLP